ncbi:hypothetical protein EJ03DRAFT_124682 [Teratosphaeria nubilosa]|uniref:Uncharacterized protein n=1 Tax=Teratosphaeria nubilosa TaxID=161662 RepID=A0A6G1LL13_9PEZI|nr:hypothetical protein EJ03DRAFT_124682 [Teratosphaeria nubilosa]
MEGDAQYFHATLYQFGDAARHEVIKRFNASMRDPAARCTYNADEHCFSLVCPPGPIGPQADEELAEILSSYITEAQRTAEGSDEPSEITRFPESSYEVEVDDAPLRYDPSHEAEGLQPEDVPRVSRLLHVINMEGASTLRFFKLDALPQGLWERTLTPRAMTRKKYTENGSTLRSVTASDWLFNGRVGQPLPPISALEETTMLSMAPFARLEGTAELQEQPCTVTPWRFKGSAVSTSQWLQGLGQIEQDDPEQEQQNVPREFQKMMVAEQSHQNPALGRVRVPAGVADPQQDSVSEGESDGRSADAEAAETGFKSLLAGDAQSDSSEEEESLANEGVGGTKKSFMHLLRGAPPASPSSSKPQSNLRPEASQFVPPSRPAVDSPPADRLASDITPVRAPPAESSLSAGGTETGGFDDFGSYGPQWAVYRNGMLQADPRIMAEWQHEHPAPTWAPPSEMSAATIRSYQGDISRTTALPLWTNRIVQNRAARGAALVDVAVSETTRSIMPPPGLMPPVTHTTQKGRQQAQPHQPALAQLIDHETNHLYDEPDTQITRAQLPPGQPLVAASRHR